MGRASEMRKQTNGIVRSLKLEEWPLADQKAWQWACRPHGRLTRGGSAAHLAETTRIDLTKRYGLYLDHAIRTSNPDTADVPASWVTPERVKSYVAELRLRVRSVTVHGSIAKLRCIAQHLDPTSNFGWLRDIENDLALQMIPTSKFDRIVESNSIVLAGLTLMEEAESAKMRTRLQRAQSYRNGLMIALLGLCPIRLKNFSSLTLNKNLIHLGENWCIVLSEKETKERRPDERPIPLFLTQYMERFLNMYRPAFRYSGKKLWVGSYGKPLSYSSVERIITETTRQTLGVPISPHLFRACGASTAYMHGNRVPNLASALLNHRGSKTTQEHYNRSRCAHYSHEFGKMLEILEARQS
jgi:integrase